MLAHCFLPCRKGEQVEASQISTSPIDAGEEEWQKKGWKQIHGTTCLWVQYHLSILLEDINLNLAFLISVSINGTLF